MLRKIRYDIRRGREENFPSCCVMFYSLAWGRLSELSQMSDSTLKSWNRLIGDPYWRFMKSGGVTSWCRIPCPNCVLKDRMGLF